MRGEKGRKKEIIGKERKTHWRKNGKKQRRQQKRRQVKQDRR